MEEDNFDSPADGLEEPTLPVGKRPSTASSRRPEAPRTKRMRVSRACDQCRAGREKCDGAQPSCQTCETQGRKCTYNEQPKKRGIQPNYIRTLEATLAWVFQSFPETEDRLTHLLPDTNDPAHQAIACKEPTSADTLHTTWRNGLVCRQIDQILSGSDIEVPKTNRPRPAVSATGPTDIPYQSPPLSAFSELSNLPPDTHNSISGTSDVQPTFRNTEAPELHLLKLPENAWMLLEHYFAFTQTWLPIIERHDVLKLMYTYPSAGLVISDTTGAGHAELWSVMALASLQLHGHNNDLDLYKKVVKSLIPQEQGFQLGHIKALLILSLAELLKKSNIAAWLLVGSAVRLLTHFNLGKGNSTTLFEGRTKHTVLAAFLLETTIASYSGALCHIRVDDIRNIGPLIEDGLEEWSPWPYDAVSDSTSGATKSPTRSISTFNSLVRTALQQHGNKQISSPIARGNGSKMGVIFELLQNASAGQGRKHPSAVLSSTSIEMRSTSQSSMAGLGHVHTHSQSSLPEFANPFMGQSHGFLGIPNETTESLTGNTPVNQLNMNNTSDLWTGESSQLGGGRETFNLPKGDATDTVQTADIFEELAMLDRTDATQNPRFMQNLGFGPDLDLAEFFGADYQFSDPSAFGDLSQNHDGASKDPG